LENIAAARGKIFAMQMSEDFRTGSHEFHGILRRFVRVVE